MRSFAIFAIITALLGCAPVNPRVLDSEQSQLQLRQIQSRAFDTTEREKTLRTVMQTLQDLSFVIDKADLLLGSVSATKLDGYALRMTVTVLPRGKKQLVVRANAQYNLSAVTDPEPYQQFFTALEKAMFLTAQQVD
ncbi:MAG: hypothetical protein DCC75_07825 [Proteobacteria bacterium]|nr:MAG: hypothetical protein DCC75_07825 [Pseudomonadota bacterium]